MNVGESLNKITFGGKVGGDFSKGICINHGYECQ
jgi:hypothetical protein